MPGVHAFRRRFMFDYSESLTLMIRNPRTWGLIGRLRSAAFMRWQLRDRELRRKVWPDYTFGCKRVLFSSYFLRALTRPNVELVTSAITRITPVGVVTPTAWSIPRLHRLRNGLQTRDFMFPMEVTAPTSRAARAGARGTS